MTITGPIPFFGAALIIFTAMRLGAEMDALHRESRATSIAIILLFELVIAGLGIMGGWQ